MNAELAVKDKLMQEEKDRLNAELAEEKDRLNAEHAVKDQAMQEEKDRLNAEIQAAKEREMKYIQDLEKAKPFFLQQEKKEKKEQLV